jgi:hypothetical protein
LEKEVKSLYADVSIAAAGAPTLERGLGVASIARDAQGVYTVTLQDKYNRLMACEVSILSASAQDLHAQLESEDVESAKTITFRTQDAAAAEQDPASGTRLLIRIDVKNSSV